MRDYMSDQKGVNQMDIRYTKEQIKEFLYYLYDPAMRVMNLKRQKSEIYAYIPWQLYEIFQMFDTKHSENFDLFDLSDKIPWKMTLSQMKKTGSVAQCFTEDHNDFIYPTIDVVYIFCKMMEGAPYDYTSPDIVRYVMDDCVLGLLAYCTSNFEGSHKWNIIRKFSTDVDFASRMIRVVLTKIIPFKSIGCCKEYIRLLNRIVDDSLKKSDGEVYRLLIDNFYPNLPYVLLKSEIDLPNRHLADIISTQHKLGIMSDLARKMIHYRCISKTYVKSHSNTIVIVCNAIQRSVTLNQKMIELFECDPEYYNEHIADLEELMRKLSGNENRTTISSSEAEDDDAESISPDITRRVARRRRDVERVDDHGYVYESKVVNPQFFMDHDGKQTTMREMVGVPNDE
mgnify:FL=1